MSSRKWEKVPLLIAIGLISLFLGASAALAANLNLDNQGASVGQTVTFTVTVEDTPNGVDALVFDIIFDNNVLSYEGFDPGELVEGFLLFHVSNPSPGTVRVAGITANPIAAGASGNLVRLNFTVAAGEASDLTFQNLKDDLVGWTTKDGSL